MLRFNALLSASLPLLLPTSFTYAHASSAHLYIPQLFTHCLPTIICVTLMPVVYLIQHLYFGNIVLLLYCVFWACHSHWLNLSHEYFVRHVFGLVQLPTFSVYFSKSVTCNFGYFAYVYCLIVSFGFMFFYLVLLLT